MHTQILATTNPKGSWSAHTLELLGDAAALAKRWNGRTGVWVLLAPGESTPDVESLAAHGCDMVLMLRSERFRTWASEAVAAALAGHVSPDCRAVLLPGTARGEEVAALLAARAGTVWVPDALTLSTTRAGALDVTAVLPGGKLSRVHRMPEGRFAILTMRPGVAEARRRTSSEPLEVEERKVDLSDVPDLTETREFLPADPKTVDLTFANRIVSAGRGAGGPEGVALVAALAEALGASPGASRMAVDLGWAPPSRQVGQTGRTVKPDLYIACGISGASHHLQGMRDSRHIVAINPDASAPIHDVAHLSLHGDLHRVIPAIIEKIVKREA